MSYVEAEFIYTEFCFQLLNVGQLLAAGWTARTGGSSAGLGERKENALFLFYSLTKLIHSTGQ